MKISILILPDLERVREACAKEFASHFDHEGNGDIDSALAAVRALDLSALVGEPHADPYIVSGISKLNNALKEFDAECGKHDGSVNRLPTKEELQKHALFLAACDPDVVRHLLDICAP